MLGGFLVLAKAGKHFYGLLRFAVELRPIERRDFGAPADGCRTEDALAVVEQAVLARLVLD
jgi:hypothetical protein